MKIDLELIFVVLAFIGIFLGVVSLNICLAKKESFKLELAKKYPECVQACKPTVCLRYKYKLERYSNDR